MKERKERIAENGIDYIFIGDYDSPDLKLPKKDRPIGHYRRLHRDDLKEEHPARYSSPVLTGERKARNRLEWVRHMNNLRNRADEII